MKNWNYTERAPLDFGNYKPIAIVGTIGCSSFQSWSQVWRLGLTELPLGQLEIDTLGFRSSCTDGSSQFRNPYHPSLQFCLVLGCLHTIPRQSRDTGIHLQILAAFSRFPPSQKPFFSQYDLFHMISRNGGYSKGYRIRQHLSCSSEDLYSRISCALNMLFHHCQ